MYMYTLRLDAHVSESLTEKPINIETGSFTLACDVYNISLPSFSDKLIPFYQQ